MKIFPLRDKIIIEEDMLQGSTVLYHERQVCIPGLISRIKSWLQHHL
jgi:hypothetical protein